MENLSKSKLDGNRTEDLMRTEDLIDLKTSSLNGHIKQSSESDNSDSYEYDTAESPKLLIGDTNISMVDELKFLGVTFDRKLS